MCFKNFLLQFFNVCTLKSWLKLEIVKSCQKQNKMSTRIHGDKNWEKIWVSWRWIQDETSDCQKNCSHHRQLYLKDNKTPYTIQLQYEYRVIRKCCILIQIHNKKYMEAIQILADYQCDISMHTISFTFNKTCTRGVFSRAGAHERSPKSPILTTLILASTREHLLC